MPSQKVFKLFQEKLGYPIPEATRRGNIAESLVKDLSGIPSGDTLSIYCDPPSNPLAHARALDFLVGNGVAKRGPSGTDFGPLIKSVAFLMTDRADGSDGAGERERQRIDAERINGYASSGSGGGGDGGDASGGR